MVNNTNAAHHFIVLAFIILSVCMLRSQHADLHAHSSDTSSDVKPAMPVTLTTLQMPLVVQVVPTCLCFHALS